MNKLFVILFAVVLGCCTAELVSDKKSYFLASTADFGVDITSTMPVYVEVSFTDTISTYEVQFQLDYSTTNVKKFSYTPEFVAVGSKIAINLNATEAEAQPSAGSFRLPSATVLLAALSCLFLGSSKTSRIVLVIAALMIAATVPAQAQVYELTLKIKMGNVLYPSFKGVKADATMSLSCPTAWTKETTGFGQRCNFACATGTYQDTTLHCAACGDQCTSCTLDGCSTCTVPTTGCDSYTPLPPDNFDCGCGVGFVEDTSCHGCVSCNIDPEVPVCVSCGQDGVCTQCQDTTFEGAAAYVIDSTFGVCECPVGYSDANLYSALDWGCLSCNIDPAVPLCIDCDAGVCLTCHAKTVGVDYVIVSDVCDCPVGTGDINQIVPEDWGCMPIA